MTVDVDQTLTPTPNELAWAVVDASPDGVIVTDARGKIVLANQLACTMFGYVPGTNSLVGHGVDDLLPESLRHVHHGQRGAYATNPRRREMGTGLELLGQRVDGSTFPVEVSLSPVTIGQHSLVIAVIRDVTSRRRADAALHSTQARLALVNERERIGRDLHDSVIQRLYGVGLTLEASLLGDVEKQHDVAQRVMDEIDATIREIRGVIADLKLSDASGDRFEDRVQKFVDAQARVLDLPIVLHVVGHMGDEPTTDVTEAVMAVLRECLANAHRHGHAQHAVVDIESGVDGWLRVVVTDDGQGFDPENIVRGDGLDNLVARANQFGGSCTVSTQVEQGTTIVWQVPLPA